MLYPRFDHRKNWQRFVSKGNFKLKQPPTKSPEILDIPPSMPAINSSQLSLYIYTHYELQNGEHNMFTWMLQQIWQRWASINNILESKLWTYWRLPTHFSTFFKYHSDIISFGRHRHKERQIHTFHLCPLGYRHQPCMSSIMPFPLRSWLS
jgi:hypothetical protein